MSTSAEKPKQYPEGATPAPVGSGPTGQICGSCEYVVRNGGKHLSCRLSQAHNFSANSGSSQNVGFDWPACERWSAGSALRIFERVRLAWGSDETFDRASLVVAGDWLAEHEHDQAAAILRDWPFSVHGFHRRASRELLDAIYNLAERAVDVRKLFPPLGRVVLIMNQNTAADLSRNQQIAAMGLFDHRDPGLTIRVVANELMQDGSVMQLRDDGRLNPRMTDFFKPGDVTYLRPGENVVDIGRSVDEFVAEAVNAKQIAQDLGIPPLPDDEPPF